jgi:hypothetical protein
VGLGGGLMAIGRIEMETSNLLNKNWTSLNDGFPDIGVTVLVISKGNEVFMAQLSISSDGKKFRGFQFDNIQMNLDWASMWRYL